MQRHQGWFLIGLIAALLAGIVFLGDLEMGKTKTGTSILDDGTFIDDAGNLIEVAGPYGRIISLYEEHTENLFSLGAGGKVIGVNTSSVFPPEVAELPRYAVNREYDIGRIIAAKPDLVLIAPEQNRKYPGPVTRLETAGLKVVSLRPESFEQFDIYIEKLAMLTGMQAVYQEKLADLYHELDEIAAKAAHAPQKNTIFIESSEEGYLTPAVGSLPYLAVKYAGGINIAGEPRPLNPADSRAPFGLERILQKAGDIDVYVTLQGGEAAGSPSVSIKQKPEFKQIKAIKEGRLYELENIFANAYTFRYTTGVNEIARFLYPEIFDDLSPLRNEKHLTRRTFAGIVVKYFHLPLYVNASSTYYDYKKFNHTYGSFVDVSWQEPDFDFIETIVMRSYLTGDQDKSGKTYFRPEAPVTRSEVAGFLNILYDLKHKEQQAKIVDIGNDAHSAVIQKVVDNGLMTADNGYFRPEATYTNQEFIAFLESLSK